jgi:signal transduction histidine kinase
MLGIEPATPPPQPGAIGMRMRTHLVLLVFIALVPVIVFSAGMMFVVALHERQALQTSLKEKAVQLADGVDHELQRTIAKLEVLGQSAALREGDLQAFDGMARRVVQADGRWENLLLLGNGGEQIVNARLPFGSAMPKLNRPDLPVRAIQSLQPVVSDMAQAVVAARPLTAIYVPVVREGTVQYVLGATIEPPNWKEALNSQLPSGMHALLLDGQSSLITATAGEGAATNAPGLLDVAGDSRGIQERVRALLGRDAYVAFQKSSSSGWAVATFVPAEEFDADLRRSGTILAAGFVVLLAFGILLALMLGQRTTNSISDLVASVKAVAHGSQPLAMRPHVAEVAEASQALTETAALLSARWRREQAARAEVEAADRAKNVFLATLGHELRNPIAALRNGVEILKRGESANDTTRRATALMDRQSAHISRLVDDLLDLARIEQGKIELRKEVIDLRELLRSTIEDQHTALDGAGLRLSLDLPASAVWIHADRVRIAQVVGNLLHNAAKFTARGGEVRVSLRERGSHAEIRIRDNGSGIAPAALESIFEPFAQGEQDGARSGGGLGLGLALVKTLVTLHGGNVRASSQGKGQGAEFTVSLPGANEAA